MPKRNEPTPEDLVRWLARQCAVRNLRLSQANSLLNTLWAADHLGLAHGSYSEVSRRTGMSRRNLYRFVCPWMDRSEEDGDAGND